MKRRPVNLRSYMVVCCLAGMSLLFQACTSPDDETIPNKVVFNTVNYYLLPGSSLIIDLRSIVSQSFVKATLEVYDQPRMGTLSRLDNFLLKYQPDGTFSEGIDKFQVIARSDDRSWGTGMVIINLVERSKDLPCGVYAVNDTIRIDQESSTQIRFRDNDLICGVDPSQLTVTIVSKPRFGNAKLNGDVIEYTPVYGFVGYDSIIYQLSNPKDFRITSGLIVITKFASGASKNWILMTRIAENPYLNTLFFLDENTGFAGGEALYKTTDGGGHWRAVLPFFMYAFNTIENIIFTDDKNGYASFSANEEYGGILKTKDGGETWEALTTPGNFITSLFFASPVAGLIGTDKGLYKTSDGGINWQLVSPECCARDIQFIDDKNGFAYSGDSILKTTDGGDSWAATGLYPMISDDPNEAIYGLSTNGQDALFLFFGQIWKTQDVKNFSSYFTRYYRYYNAISFSASGKLGLVVGQFPNGSPEALISKDGGSTWTSSLQDWPIHFDLKCVSVPSDKVAFAVSSDGYVVKYEEK